MHSTCNPYHCYFYLTGCDTVAIDLEFLVSSTKTSKFTCSKPSAQVPGAIGSRIFRDNAIEECSCGPFELAEILIVQLTPA